MDENDDQDWVLTIILTICAMILTLVLIFGD